MIKDTPNNRLLKKYTDLLLEENTDWHTKRETLLEIGKLFANMDAYSFEKEKYPAQLNEVKLDSGYAVSTWSAAMCLLEISRTIVF